MRLFELENVMDFLNHSDLMIIDIGGRIHIDTKYELGVSDIRFIYGQWKAFFDHRMYEDNSELASIVERHIRDYIISVFHARMEKKNPTKYELEC